MVQDGRSRGNSYFTHCCSLVGARTLSRDGSIPEQAAISQRRSLIKTTQTCVSSLCLESSSSEVASSEI